MLNNISQLTLADEAQQQRLEEELAKTLPSTLQKNITAFQQYAPYLVDILESVGDDSLSVFCTSEGKANIVDYATGQCWYGVNPEVEIKRNIECQLEALPVIRFQEEGVPEMPAIEQAEDTPFLSPDTWQAMQGQRVEAFSSHTPLFIIFGIGIGHALQELSNTVSSDAWLIYEPSIDVFKESTKVFDWAAWLEDRVSAGEQVYLQVGNSGGSLVEDLQFIASEHTLSTAYIYRHYHHHEMDALYQYLTSALFSWSELLSNNVSLYPFVELTDEVPPIRPYVRFADLDSTRFLWQEAKQRFLFNLKALEYYYPDVAQAFSAYQPTKWHLMLAEDKSWNLLHIERGATLYGENSKAEANLDFELYSKNPAKDDPLLNVDGGKLRGYLHYRKTAEIKKLINQSHNEAEAQLPKELLGIVLFGLGLGFSFESLLENHKVSSVYLYEPNFDFFYASLYVLDWHSILKNLDDEGGRLYLNLGDDGSYARNDLTLQMQKVGPYNIVGTYLYPVYHHSVMQQSMFDLKEELKVVLSIGEYFEHARYGLSHMKAVFSSGSAYLVKRTEGSVYQDLKDYPIFIVGNGPSLDSSYEYIIENRNRVVVVSCGTALRALYKYGIQPDFHAEIEQNRATYNWVSNAGDRDYLNGITLLSVNGVHPDTSALFKRTLLMFKAGEASTRSYMDTICPSYRYPDLEYAYPTVSNLAIAIMCAFDMRQLYLFGIDLGFKDVEHHHSKQSDYYLRNNTNEPTFRIEYAKQFGIIVVPGNFEEQVFSKHEFRISAQNIERVLSLAPNVSCFNCSDGALVNGAKPLLPKELLLSEQDMSSSNFVDELIERLCVPAEQVAELPSMFEKVIDMSSLKRDVDSHIAWIKGNSPNSETDLEKLLAIQREKFYSTLDDRSSLFFYMFWGSMNYVSSLLLKLAYTSKDQEYKSRLHNAWQLWAEYMEEVFMDYYNDPDGVDQTQAKNRNFVATVK